MTNSRSSGTTTQQYLLTTSFTTTSTSFVIVTAMTLTLKNNQGRTLVLASIPTDNSGTNSTSYISLHDDGAQLEGVSPYVDPSANVTGTVTIFSIVNNDASAIAVYMKAAANTGRVFMSDTTAEPKLEFLEFP